MFLAPLTSRSISKLHWGALEVLATSQTLMHMAALTTSLARVGLVDNDHSAPWVLTGLVQQALFEPIVRPWLGLSWI